MNPHSATSYAQPACAMRLYTHSGLKRKKEGFILTTEYKDEVGHKPCFKQANEVKISIEKKESICRIMRENRTSFQVFIPYAKSKY